MFEVGKGDVGMILVRTRDQANVEKGFGCIRISITRTQNPRTQK
jgi:hypothetical protein